MNTLSVVVLGLASAYFLWLSFAMETKNMRSAFFFKMVPFLLAAGLTAVGFVEMGMIIMPASGG